LAGFTPGARYRWTWFNPRTGAWVAEVHVSATASGVLSTPALPANFAATLTDWAAKLVRVP
jgi:hypothetical protein